VRGTLTGPRVRAATDRTAVLATHRCIWQQPLSDRRAKRDTRRAVDLCTPDGCHAVKSDGHFSLNP